MNNVHVSSDILSRLRIDDGLEKISIHERTKKNAT